MKIATVSMLFAFSLSAANPLAGTWRLDFDKSPGATPQISKFEHDGEFLKNTNGPIGYRFKIDGKPHPAPSAQFDTVIWRQTGPRKFEHATTKDGKTVYTVVTEVGANGLTRSYRHTRILENGKTVVNDGVQERVGGETDPANPLIGHWRLRQVMQWKQSGNQLQYRGGTLSYSAALDGKEHPATGSSTIDTVSLRRLSANAIEVTGKKEGKLVYATTHTVSSDGTTLTSKSPNRGDLVFDRVKHLGGKP